MSVAVTGATGLVGRFFVEDALVRGERVLALTRSAPEPGFFSAPVQHMPYELGNAPDLSGVHTLIHCAFSHVPGRYRGGEGDNPAAFIRKNYDGTVTLFEAAKAQGVQRIVFLSSRAVYDGYPPDQELVEGMKLSPQSLYGDVKLKAERALEALTGPDLVGQSLRATGVYGPARLGQRHKWADLFDDFIAGRPIAPRRGTEVHGADLARAIPVLADAPSGPYNLSDILLDRQDLLAAYARLTGCSNALPARADMPISQMSTARARSHGWKPGGSAALERALAQMA